jgi:hypothetical protein
MQHTSARSIQTGELPPVVAGLPIVNVWYDGHSIGLYRVMRVDERAMVLKHGAISFPVGTLLDVVDFQRLVHRSAFSRLSTTVADNTSNGIRLVW